MPAHRFTKEDCNPPGSYRFTPENARENQLKSAQKRRENKLLRESFQQTMDMLLKKSVKEGKMIDVDGLLSIAETEGKNISVQQAMSIAVIQKALSGDVQAIQFIRDTLGEKPVEKVETQMTIEDYVKEHKVKL